MAATKYQPVPFNPRLGNFTELPISPVALAEVRVSLMIDETFGWMIPVQFAIGPLLTAAEIIEKIANTCFFLEAWSQAHLRRGPVRIRLKHLKLSTTATPLIQ